MEQSPNESNPETPSPYHDILQRAESDTELAQYLETLRLAGLAAALHPDDPQAQRQRENAEHLVRNYLGSGESKPEAHRGEG
jgi:hypothetical protein